MKKCSVCATENKDTSTFCMECGRALETPPGTPLDHSPVPPSPRPPRPSRHILRWVLVGLLAVALLAGGIASLVIFGSDRKPEEGFLESADDLLRGLTGREGKDVRVTKQKAPGTIVTTGRTVKAGDLEVRVGAVERESGKGMQKAGKGNEFVVLQLGLRNNSRDVVNVSALMQMRVMERSGKSYSPGIYFPDPALASEITAGSKVEGKVAFEVPAGRKDLLFVFDPDPLTDKGAVGVELF